MSAAPAAAAEIDIPEQDLSTALVQLGRQAGVEIAFAPTTVDARQVRALQGDYEANEALSILLADTGLSYRTASNGAIVVEEGVTEIPQSDILLAQAETGGSSTGRTREKIIVTGQKREEYIQDVPIAISAFSQEDLTISQIAGGPDLITQIPNFAFTKTNFSGYSIQIRGIGTQAISATTDPAVAVAFNNTPFIRNRFFEQEFYDMERVEVLRGPQGTLYGRNATAGVVNLISAKPIFDDEARMSLDVGNYNSRRIEGMVNIPIVDDQVALRIAGASTKRDGYATNEISGGPIDGRDLWSTRVSLRFAPNDRLDANLIWEHFEEDDDRLRSGKQLCNKDVVDELGGFAFPDFYQGLPNTGQPGLLSGTQATFSQGCERKSLYANESFQRPNGLMLPYYFPLSVIGLPNGLTDPYVSVLDPSQCSLSDCPGALVDATNDQPEDLRVIQSTIDPTYRAKTDLGELQFDFELTDDLTLTSESAYGVDMVYSLQDFNRFNTAPGAWEEKNGTREGILEPGPNGDVFCDPQLGCSDRLVVVDISTAKARQFSQEFRLASSYAGPFNFSLGANFFRSDSKDKYYVFANSLTMSAADTEDGRYSGPYVAGETDNAECLRNGFHTGDPNQVYPVTGCTYIDPNPIDQVNDQGHNYFLSNNPFKLISYAAFGEAYWNLTDNLKLTAGLRYTVDKKEAPRIPTWTLASQYAGYPVAEVIKQEWREPTGRITADWKPDLGFTEETLIYGSYARGYKAGGANPPGFVRSFYADADVALTNTEASLTRPRTFDAEYVDAFEIGSKNTFLDGDVTLNAAAFYYDYTGYQVSEIVDRSAFNRNFDAEVWGLEFEAEWWALENLRLSFKGGYENTRIADGEEAIDLMDRTAGDPRWTLTRPFPTYASSCILPTWVFVANNPSGGNPEFVNLGGVAGGNPGGCELAYQIGTDPGAPSIGHGGVINYTDWSTNPDDYPGVMWPGGVVTDTTYPGWDPLTAPNGGEGIAKPLGGNELPNAPPYTATISGDYILPLGPDWTLIFHGDFHYQSESWWRVFNDHEFSRLNEYYTMNLAAILKSEDGWNVMGYIKNVTDETAITGAFLNSDDTGLTTNVFLTEPRLYGVRVTKDWTGGTFLGGLVGGEKRDPDKPYAVWVELGGQVLRVDAPNTPFTPTFSDEFTDPLDIFEEAQDEDLDWGDGRSAKVSWRPYAGRWTVSGSYRYGKVNNFAKFSAEQETDPICVFGGPLSFFCSLTEDPNYGPLTRLTEVNNSQALINDVEEHEMIDFMVGRDIDVGGLDRSTVSAGLRSASFDSTTNAELRGVPDWGLEEGFVANPVAIITTTVPHTYYRAFGDAKRDFDGVGPFVQWDAAKTLFDLGQSRVNVDWSLSGGVLFGDESTLITGRREIVDSYDTLFLVITPGPIRQIPTPIPTTSVPTEFDPIERKDSINAPFLGASLGVSYNADRFKIGAGYRWEQYYDVIDGGVETESMEDRTLDGPYLNVSVGFGG